MKYLFKKVVSSLLVLTLAVVTAGVSASAAAAYTPDPYTELLWYSDVDLSVPFTMDIDFDPIPDPSFQSPVTLGYNLIEIFNLEGDNYLLALHPQFLPYYDEQKEAQYVFGIDTLSVWNKGTQEYDSIPIKGDTAAISTDYTLYNEDEDKYYLKCEVDLTLTNMGEGGTTPSGPVYWNPAFLEIPSSDVPPARSSAASFSIGY